MVTSSPEDQRLFNELRQLSQTMLQNGATPYEIINLYSTNSIRQMKKIFKNLKEKQDELVAQQQEMEQAKIQQQQEAVQMQLEQQARENEIQRNIDMYEAEMERINKKEIALINQLGRNPAATADADKSGVPDALEVTRLADDRMATMNDFNLRMQEISAKKMEIQKKLEVEKEKLENERQNMKNDLQIAKINAKNRANKKTK